MLSQHDYAARMQRSSIYIDHQGTRTAPALVLVHGAPDRSSGFRGVLPYLASRHVVTYDRRGYGRSLHAAAAGSMMDHANDLLAILDECHVPPIVVAHSFGSNPSMLAASVRPSAFAAIGLWEPPIPWVEWWPEEMRAYITEIATSNEPADEIEVMYRKLLGDQVWDDLSPEVQAARRAEGAAFQIDMASELDAPFEFQNVPVPALVGYGTDTVAHHSEGAIWLVKRLPDARLYQIPGAGHFAPRTHPEEFAKFIDAAVSMAASAHRPGLTTAQSTGSVPDTGGHQRGAQ
jgi:pimeloyl-ACP methyl ester carboxylesterase